MHRQFIVIGCLLLALIAAPAGAAFAQDGFSPEQEAALETDRRAVDGFFALETYTVAYTQTLHQAIGVSLGAQAITIDQQIEQQGTTITERQAGNRFDNQFGTVDQTVTQTLSGDEIGQEQTVTLTQTLEMIVLDDRAYMRLASDDPQVSAFFPEGWQDITENAIPGMEMYNMEQLLATTSTAFSAEMFDALFGAVAEIELLEPETLDGAAVERVHLVFDPAAALSGETAGGLRDMFNAAAMPFDVEGLLDLIFSDEDTAYAITLFLGAEDGTLYGYDVVLKMDVAIPSELVTDPSLAGAEMSLAQESVSTLRFTDQNEPAAISAPPLEE